MSTGKKSFVVRSSRGRRGATLAMIFIATMLITYTSNRGVAGSGGDYEFETETIVETIDEDIFFEIVDPPELGYTYRIRPAQDFGTRFNGSFPGQKIALVPVEPETGCSRADNSDELEGSVALVKRGNCTFVHKSAIAEEAGAVAIIVADYHAKSIDDERNSPMWKDYYYIDMTNGDDEDERKIGIPAGFMLGKNGKVIRDTLRRLKLPYAIINIPVNLTFAPLSEFHQPPWVAL